MRAVWVLPLLLFPALAVAQATRPVSTTAPTTAPAEPRGFSGQIVLAPDDVPAFPDPPAGFDRKRLDIAHGRLEMVSYDSKTVGVKRRMLVYTPPGYQNATDAKHVRACPVLYLLHGIGGDENEWQHFAHVDVLLDNLIADGKAQPMIVVMPNGRARVNDRPGGGIMEQVPAFEAFTRDLLDDVIPAIESRYSVARDRDHRALAGLSMGGGQTLNIGLSHPNDFAYLGAFSAAPNTRLPPVLLPQADAAKRFKLLFFSCGTRDGLIWISQAYHRYLTTNHIPHTWHITVHAHEPAEWEQALYWFAQQVFRQP